MMTPSRKASRATVITVSIAIGVFGAGAGLGTVIASRSHPDEGQVLRLAAGTYHLADGERAWKSRGAADRDQGVPLSGADEGSTIAKKESKDPRLCLTATADGHAVGGGAAGCVALPAVLAGAAAPLQRPGNPRSTGSAPPKKASSAPEPRRSTAAQPAPATRRTAAQPDPAPPRTAAQPPPARPVRSAPSPTQTKKIAGDISESGSLVEKPAAQAEKKRDVNTAPKEPTPKSAPPSGTPRPEASPSAVQPTPPPNTAKPTATTTPPGTAEPSRPTATPRPSHTHRKRNPHRPGNPTPSGTLPPAQPSSPVTPSPDTQLPTPAPDTQLPSPDQNPSQTPDATVLPTAQPSAPNGEITENGDSLPIFQDPELLRRAQEALGLDRNMRYTDENGVWDLNIAPPGTPPCRNYSAAELQKLDAPQSGSPAIPRDSCQWPAFIRWLYAEPAPGEVSNWTKFTGLPERNLELVVTDPSTLPPAPAGTSQVEPDTGQVQPDTRQIRPDTRQVQPDTRQVQPGTGQVQPDTQQIRPDTRQVRPDTGQVQPGTGQVQPDPFGYNDQ
ncbi:hypothetical protein [Streptosporangium roseum]|uniref:Uncharacterized protein n=1 Tax=Streptosporangium roseum (strain ATCC 12428 / DSM 43021 / JCM 3005 / KCTC 9067 / NCIMB 10171 / NRRL 2505 / NI 9100) TaxID=479432 RepID=D2BCP8_STRRD|nr:hypothetical protein [Streptosporangium roseum]ACZ91868.1 hypothetical protein Sros_9250 [Streptosporangium roseum DSM 43021]